jgi:hypothetical protein
MKQNIDPKLAAAWDLEDRHWPFFGHPHCFVTDGKLKKTSAAIGKRRARPRKPRA